MAITLPISTVEASAPATATPINAVDNRIVRIRLGQGTQSNPGEMTGDNVTEFTETFEMSVRTHKDVLHVQNTCRVTIDNLTTARRNALTKYFTMWRARNFAQPFIPMDVRIGRKSTPDKLITVFRGSILQSNFGNPPDTTMDLECQTSLMEMNIASTNYISNVAPRLGTFKALCQWAADLVGYELRYEVSTNLPAIAPGTSALVVQKAYSLSAIVGMLANMHKTQICVFADDGVLVVCEWGVALQGEAVTVDATSGLIGIPAITQWGVRFTTLADTPIRVAGQVTLNSKMNPDVNQNWIVTGVDYDITSRGNSFYATWTASPPPQT